MPKNPSQNLNNSSRPSLTASWTAGPRNPAWDALWRRLFGEAIRPALDLDGTRDPSTTRPSA
jgi:hypothetical protein